MKRQQALVKVIKLFYTIDPEAKYICGLKTIQNVYTLKKSLKNDTKSYKWRICQVLHSRVGSWPYLLILTRLEWPARAKTLPYSKHLQNTAVKKFYKIDTWWRFRCEVFLFCKFAFLAPCHISSKKLYLKKWTHLTDKPKSSQVDRGGVASLHQYGTDEQYGTLLWISWRLKIRSMFNIHQGP